MEKSYGISSEFQWVASIGRRRFLNYINTNRYSKGFLDDIPKDFSIVYFSHYVYIGKQYIMWVNICRWHYITNEHYIWVLTLFYFFCQNLFQVNMLWAKLQLLTGSFKKKTKLNVYGLWMMKCYAMICIYEVLGV